MSTLPIDWVTLSMQWYQVKTFSLQQDLSDLLQLLTRQNLPHRVTEELQGQCLWIADERSVETLRQFIDAGGIDKLALQQPTVLQQTSKKKVSPRQIIEFWNRFPVTLLTIYFGVLGALLLVIDRTGQWLSLLTFQPLVVHGNQMMISTLSEGLQQGQWWRLITPVFLHFGLFHILFNGLWVWEFGRRLESFFGSTKLLALMLFLAIVSNASQYFWSGPSMFGGLSGVLYGLMGFLWIYERRKPSSNLKIQEGIIGFMLLWMVLCMTGVVNIFMEGRVANGAHLGGLVAGMLAGYFSANSAKAS